MTRSSLLMRAATTSLQRRTLDGSGPAQPADRLNPTILIPLLDGSLHTLCAKSRITQHFMFPKPENRPSLSPQRFRVARITPYERFPGFTFSGRSQDPPLLLPSATLPPLPPYQTSPLPSSLTPRSLPP